MVKRALLLAAILAASPAIAGGLRHEPPARGYGQGYYNYAPRGYVPPGYLRGYLAPDNCQRTPSAPLCGKMQSR